MKLKSGIAMALVFTLYALLLSPVSRVIADTDHTDRSLRFFEDHFEASYINENWEVIDGPWTITNGQLKVPQGKGYKALVNNLEVQDFTIEAEISLANRTGDAGFILRSSEASPGADNIVGYYAGISAANNGSVFLGAMNFGWKELKRAQVNLDPQAVYQFKVTVTGNQFSFYIDDKLVLQHEDNTYDSGRVGIRMYDSLPAYDNVTVRNESGSVMFTDTFDNAQDASIGKWLPVDGDWSMQSGRIEVGKGPGPKLLAKDLELRDDYTIETELRLLDGGGDAGLLFGVKEAGAGADNVRGYYAGLRASGDLILGQFNNSFTDLQVEKVLDRAEQQQPYRLKIVTRGKVIKVYLNDMHKPVIEYTVEDPSDYSTGQIGLRAYEAKAAFDNFIASEYRLQVPEIQAPVANKDPLVQTPFIPLPLGSVEAEGWLLKQLEYMKEGATGYAEDLYAELGGNAEWLGGNAPDSNWERPVYYVKGLLALAYTLKDPDLIAKSQKWVNWMLESQKEDGNFGPASDFDWWPRMVAVYVLKDYYEATGDERVISHLTKYFKYQLEQLDKRPLRDWGKIRFGDNMNVVLWLYNHTGDNFLLDLARKLNEQGYAITDVLTNNKFYESARANPADFYTQHTVNVNQMIKNPAIYYQLSQDKADYDAYFRGVEHLDQYHNQITAINAGTEMLSGLSSVQGVELCAIVERIHSNSMTAMITGDPHIGDLQEKLAFNALPAAMSKDLKTHQYYTLPNQIESGYDSLGFKQGYSTGAMQSIISGFPCCRFNLHMGWPYFVKEMWAATDDGGLGIIAYGPSKVSTLIQGQSVVIKERTNYPFEETIYFDVEELSSPTQFPLKLRIPAWSNGATLTVNGEPQAGVTSGEYYVIDRVWSKGDTVALTVPMEIKTSTWINNSVGIERGPLVYSLEIEEEWKSAQDPAPQVKEPGFEEYYIYAKTPWNYGLLMDREHPGESIEVVVGEMTDDPFNQPPVKLIAQGKQIPEWGKRPNNSIHADEPPSSPVFSAEPTVDVTLVPYGSQNLRISYFPEVTEQSASTPMRYEAEKAKLNRAKINSGNVWASGGSYVGEIDYPDSYVRFENVEAPQAGMYKMFVWYAQNTNNFSPASAKVIVNGEQQHSMELAGTINWGRFMAASVNVELQEGTNQVQFMRGDGAQPGFYELDYIVFAKLDEPENPEVPEPKITAGITGEQSVKSGAQTELTYALQGEVKQGFEQIHAQGFKLQFDPAALKLVDVASARGEALHVAVSEDDPNAGTAYVLATSKGVSLDTDGDWLKLRFEAVAEKETDTTIQISSQSVANEKGDELALADLAYSLRILPKDSKPGNGDNGSGSTWTPPAPSHEIIKEQETITLKLLSESASGSLPIKEIGERALRITAGGTVITIDPAVLKEWLGGLAAGAVIEASVKPVDEAAAKKASSTSGLSNTKPAGAMQQWSIQLKEPGKPAVDLMTAIGGAAIAMSYGEAADAELLGIYEFNEKNGRWEFVGGKTNGGKQSLTGRMNQSGSYAVLEYKKTFADVPAGHWAAKALQTLSAKHIIQGVSETQFAPNRQTTRAEFAALLVRMLELGEASATIPFADVPANEWYAKDVASAYYAGLVTGVTPSTFQPNAVITREQMALMLVRAYELAAGSAAAGNVNAPDFKDAQQISGWARTGVNQAVAIGLMQGKGEGRFAPGSHTTRAETAQAIYNLLQLINNESREAMQK